MKRAGAAIMMASVVLLAIAVAIVSNVQANYKSDMEAVIFNPVNFTAERQSPNLSENTPHGQISVEHLESISDNLYERFPFTYKEMHAAKWIVEELLAMGYTWDNIEVQEYSWTDALAAIDNEEFAAMGLLMGLYFVTDQSPFMHLDTRVSQQSQNVILTVPGQSSEKIVVSAHYDSVFYPGVSDNGSGVALLLESAQRIREKDNYYTIEYVFFGSEEMGLFGSYYYTNSLTGQQHDNIQFIINADVLIEGPDLFYMAGYDEEGEPGTNHITETWDRIAQEMNAQHGIKLHPWPEGVFGPSDQLAFLPKGHTAMFLVGLDLAEDFEIEEGNFDAQFMDMVRVLHSPRDEFHHVYESWPDKMETNMRGFSIFLEEILLADYD
jgi:hypothetical protein